ncbi:MAG: UDP-N-acetylmuramoyl-L-alanyl-D-glutamate--2,6-diaminopimelate ligase [Bacilli bacterium]|nr:UDP-N-acetylmuramoyl-L-alanyl-D-glutamate--2,6-diaminopimelate ligase [Bacilli bacterium]
MINIKSDSRKIKPGDTFVALKCVDNDGHKFVDKAIENGASKVIVEHGNYSVETQIVDNTRDYITSFLKEKNKKELEKIKIIGITGTNGKTTSAFLLYQALNLAHHKAAYIGTIGFYMDKKITDLPNTTVDIVDLYELLLDCVDNNVEYVVMEVSSEGFYRRRVEGIKFNYAAFTNLTQDHLNIHGTMENYMKAKLQLFDSLDTDAKAFINIDDPYYPNFMLEKNNNIGFGFKDCEYQVIDYQMNNKGSVFSYKHNDIVKKVKSTLIGKYNIYNLILAISILNEIGIDNIESIISKLTPPPGRMDIVLYNNNSIIIDYAHTPDAVENIVKTIKQVTKGKVYVIFGCTGDRDKTKRPIMFNLVAKLSDYFIITNDDPHNEDEQSIVNDMIKGSKETNYEVCLDRKKAIEKGIKLLNIEDSLLILGMGHQEYMIIKNEKIPYNDKKTVLSIIGK